MPIGGGTFTVQNKILPGAYINFVSLGSVVKMGTRGVAALPLELNWGPENKVFSVYAEDFNKNALSVFGYDPTADDILLVKEALKRARTLMIYRVNSGGKKATATVGGVTVTAACGGTRGNAISVAILTNADNATNVDVVTYLDGMVMDSQTVAKATGSANLKANDFATFGSASSLTPAVATPLTGGTNGTVNGAAHTAALNAFEVESFNVVGYPGTDEEIKSLYATFVKRLRDDEGKKIVGVLHDYKGDNIGLINVKNGVVLNDGTTVTGDKAVAWVSGASAGAEINESLTNTAYDDAVDVDIKYTKSQFEAAIQAGEFVFYADYGKARVLTDINSLTSFGGGVTEDWTSNRVIRVLDGWANDVARIFGDSYIGKVTNSDTGRQLFKADLVSLALQYQDIDAISDFVSEDILNVTGHAFGLVLELGVQCFHGVEVHDLASFFVHFQAVQGFQEVGADFIQAYVHSALPPFRMSRASATARSTSRQPTSTPFLRASRMFDRVEIAAAIAASALSARVLCSLAVSQAAALWRRSKSRSRRVSAPSTRTSRVNAFTASVS